MAVEVIMPQMGESIFEGTVTKWLKKPGDRIERDEPLLEISTDKVDAEIPSPAAGVLREIKVAEGQTVPVQTVVAVIETAAAAAGAGGAAAAETPQQEGTAQAAPVAAVPAAAGGVPGRVPGRTPEDARRVRSSPLARRLARENRVDLAQLQGSGAGGRISKQDVLAAAARGGTPAASGAQPAAEPGIPRERIYFGNYEVQPLSVMRQRIAEHMAMSKHISPHVYSIEEADLTRIVEMRGQSEAEFEKRHQAKLTFMPFFVRACVGALREFPALNASLDGINLVLHKEINIGIAVALEEGLIVPVVTGADEKNFLGLQRAISDLAERARAKKLKPEEVQHSTFTITNPGVFGGLMGLPIINQPNLAILAIGAIQKRPVVVDDQVVIRSMAYLTMSYDHRAVDGAAATRFLGKVKGNLEGWSEAIL